MNPEAVFTAVGQIAIYLPESQRRQELAGGAYSPLTNDMYYPLQNTCMTATAQIDKPTLYVILRLRQQNADYDGHDKVGPMHAISAETGKPIWKYEQRAATQSLVATGGGLLFGGDAQGRFVPSTRTRERCCGKSIWGRRSPDIRSRTPVDGKAIHRGEHRRFAGDRRYKRFDPRTPFRHGQQSLRVCLANKLGDRVRRESLVNAFAQAPTFIVSNRTSSVVE